MSNVRNAALRTSILNAAIHGLLTHRLATDGDSSSTLEKCLQAKKAFLGKKWPKNYRFIEPSIDWEKPESWMFVRLSDLGDVVGGGTPDTLKIDYWKNGDVEWMTPAEMGKTDGFFLRDAQRRITKLGLANCSAELLPSGSVIMSSRAPIGYIGINRNPMATSQGCKSLRLYDPESVDPKYVVLAIKAMMPEIIKMASTMTFKEVSGTKFGSIVIPLPPTEEQHRIVKKVEALLPLLDRYENLQRELAVLSLNECKN